MTPHMLAPTRRQLIVGSAGMLVAAGSGFPLSTFAQGATPDAEPGSAHAFQVGSFSCLAISDGSIPAPGITGFFFANVDPAELEQALADAGVDPAQVVIQLTSVLIDTGSELVLVDTGNGTTGLPATGNLPGNLQREGIQPADIDVVVNTHGHADHIGGNAAAGGDPVYANARYVMSLEEWDFWTDTARVEAMIPVPDFRQGHINSVAVNLLPLEGVFDLIGYDEEIVSGVTSVAAQGHTPGHMAVRVESDGDMLWILGDAALHPLTLAHPGFTGVPDTEPERAVETRERLFAEIADAAGLAALTHFDPFPSVGHIVAAEDAWAWQPVEAEPVA